MTFVNTNVVDVSRTTSGVSTSSIIEHLSGNPTSFWTPVRALLNITHHPDCSVPAWMLIPAPSWLLSAQCSSVCSAPFSAPSACVTFHVAFCPSSHHVKRLCLAPPKRVWIYLSLFGPTKTDRIYSELFGPTQNGSGLLVTRVCLTPSKAFWFYS